MSDATDLVAAGVLEGHSSVDESTRWKLRPGTVTVAGDTTVIVTFDGDGFDGSVSVPIPMTSLIGYVPVTARVMVITIPPSGNYIISRVFGSNGADLALTEWVDYFPTLSSSGGAQPSVGTGEVTGRWRVVDWRTIEVEVLTDWGAGPSQGVGTYFWTPPFAPTARSIAVSCGPCHIFDAGVADRTGIVAFFDVDHFYVAASPNITLGAGTPNTWTAGDKIKFSIFYEIVSFS